MRRRTAALALTLLLTGGSVVACGGDDDGDGDGDSAAERAQEEKFKEAAGDAADQTICAADATAIPAPYDAAFPSAWTFPADTTVYDVEDRGETGVIVTAISTAPFQSVLDHLNGEEQQLGFTVVSGETEDDDAEADWTSDGFTGRWAIRRSGTCAGETVIQVLATAAG